jgi:hypothetical protein
LSILDAGYWSLVAGYWILDAGYLVTGYLPLVTCLLYITLRIGNQASINNQMTEDREQIADEFGI